MQCTTIALTLRSSAIERASLVLEGGHSRACVEVEPRREKGPGFADLRHCRQHDLCLEWSFVGVKVMENHLSFAKFIGSQDAVADSVCYRRLSKTRQT